METNDKNSSLIQTLRESPLASALASRELRLERIPDLPRDLKLFD